MLSNNEKSEAKIRQTRKDVCSVMIHLGIKRTLTIWKGEVDESLCCANQISEKGATMDGAPPNRCNILSGQIPYQYRLLTYIKSLLKKLIPDQTTSVKFSVKISKGNKYYVTRVPELGVTTQGKTKEEAKKNLREALQLHLEAMTEYAIEHGKVKIDKAKLVTA